MRAKLEHDEILKRAKALYFVNRNVKEIYADEFGRFGYIKENLVQLNRDDRGEVYHITREMALNVDASPVEILGKPKKEKKNAEDKK